MEPSDDNVQLKSLNQDRSWFLQTSNWTDIDWKSKRFLKQANKKSAAITKTKGNMCSTRIIRNKLCKKVYTVLFILLYGLFSTTHAAISNRNNKSSGERWILLPIFSLLFFFSTFEPGGRKKNFSINVQHLVE